MNTPEPPNSERRQVRCPIASSECPSHQQLVDFVACRVSSRDGEALVDLLDQCSECSIVVESLESKSDDRFLNAMLQSAGDSRFAQEPALARAAARIARIPSEESENLAETISVTEPTHRSDSRRSHSPTSTFLNSDEYEIIHEIARGGMGVVYKAQQTRLGRPVALKIIKHGELASKDEVDRFRLEASAAANLDHPAIVPIYEIGEMNGQPFFSMAFIEGKSLSERIRESPLDSKDAARVCASVARAVGYAHDQGVIHRDLKPGNILIDTNGSPHVTDFGLAKQLESDSDLTNTGQVLGTPSYMPPEQASGETESVDRRSDVYSLGAVLYCCLTGRPPFQGTSPAKTVLQVISSDSVSPRTLNPTINRDLETICLKCLEKEPSRRYADANSLADDLDRWLNNEPVLARPSTFWERSWKWARRRPAIASMLIALLVAVIALVGASVAAFYNARLRESINITQQAKQLAERERHRTSVALDKAEEASREARIADYYRRIAQAQLELNDGDIGRVSQLLYKAPEELRAWEWNFLIRKRYPQEFVLDSGPPALIHPISEHEFVVIGVRENNSIQVWNRITRKLVRQCRFEGRCDLAATVSEDGLRAAVVTTDHHLQIFDLSEMSKIATHRFDNPNEMVPSALCFLSDDRLAMAEHLLHANGRIGDAQIRIFDLGLGKQSDTIPLEYRCGELHALPNNRLLASGGGAAHSSFVGRLMVVDLASGDVQSHKTHKMFCTSLDVDATGSLVALASVDETASILRLDSLKKVADLVGHRGSVNSIRFSEDDKSVITTSDDLTVRIWDVESGKEKTNLRGHSWPTRMAYMRKNHVVSGGGEPRLFVWNVDKIRNGDWSRNTSSHIVAADFSEGGRKVAFATTNAIRIVDLETDIEVKCAGDHTGVSGHHGHVQKLQFFANDSRLLSIGYQGNVRTWDTSTGQHVDKFDSQISSGLRTGALSTDGKWIACGGYDDRIVLWNLNTKERQEIRRPNSAQQGVLSMVFHPTTNQLFCSGQDDSGHAAFSIDINSFEPQFLARCTNGTPRCVAINGDGTKFAMGTSGGVIIVVDLETSEETELLGHRNIVSDLCFSPTESRLASASLDQTIKIWDTETGAETITLRDAHKHGVQVVRFHPDGKRLLSAGFDGAIRLWDARQKE